MASKWLGRIFAAGLLLLLAGCFRSAGDSVEEPTQGAPLTLPAQNPPTETPLSAPPATSSSGGLPQPELASPTFPPITIIPATKQTNDGQSPTPIPQQVEASPNAIPNAAPSETPQFITPGIPLGPFTPETATFTPTGGAFTSTPSGLVTPTDLFGSTECTHTVAPGDNLYRIAISNGVTLDEMRAANPNLVGENPILQIGDVLNLPNCTTTIPTESGGETGITPVAGGTVYTVQPGDTLFSIAQRNGITVQAIVDANHMTDPNHLAVGQQLIIPGQSGG
jgi:LysM repeat protein